MSRHVTAEGWRQDLTQEAEILSTPRQTQKSVFALRTTWRVR